MRRHHALVLIAVAVAALGLVSHAGAATRGCNPGGTGAARPGRCRGHTDVRDKQGGAPRPAGGPFHYAIAGTVTDAGFSLELSSQDAKAKIDAPSAEACQLLADLGQEILDQFVKGPFPLDFEVAPGQTTVTVDQSDGGTTIKATLTRVKG